MGLVKLKPPPNQGRAEIKLHPIGCTAGFGVAGPPEKLAAPDGFHRGRLGRLEGSNSASTKSSCSFMPLQAAGGARPHPQQFLIAQLSGLGPGQLLHGRIGGSGCRCAVLCTCGPRAAGGLEIALVIGAASEGFLRLSYGPL